MAVTPYEMVLEFHEKFGAAINQPFSADLIELRVNLIDEEAIEVWAELEEFTGKYRKDINKVKLTKELADLMYVTIGTAITFGLPLEEVFAEVHKSNMSKLTKEGYVLRREDGKVLKSDQYQEPDLEKYF